MEHVTDDRVLKVLRKFRESSITLVEWETPLLQCLGYPLAPQSVCPKHNESFTILTFERMIYSAGLQNDNRAPSYMAEHARKGYHYVYGESGHKFILVPISWTGIQQKELVAINSPTLPCPIWTVPIPAFCAAYLRIIMQEHAGTTVRLMANADLASVIGYSMFDMTYEGDYMPTPEDLEHLDAAKKERMAEKDALEMENALSSIKQWQFTEETEWARDMMLDMAPLPAHMKAAAQAFSSILAEHNIEHAFIGGFALDLLGSYRETRDIDVEVAMDDAQPNGIRSRLAEILRGSERQRFVVLNLKLFLIPDGGHWDLRVPVETLARGMLGLPRRLSTLRPGEAG
ncbi:hypothetical protein FPRO03_10248 [Fusarium proliferatum]|nr:hypothetical protein FPRO03_10248 [Fusarium proliferatum]